MCVIKSGRSGSPQSHLNSCQIFSSQRYKRLHFREMSAEGSHKSLMLPFNILEYYKILVLKFSQHLCFPLENFSCCNKADQQIDNFPASWEKDKILNRTEKMLQHGCSYLIQAKDSDLTFKENLDGSRKTVFSRPSMRAALI